MNFKVWFSLLTILTILTGGGQMLYSQVEATKTDSLLHDDNGNELADPGDSLQYKSILKNTGMNPATGLEYEIEDALNLNLNTNSIRTSPVAADDMYEVTGNVGIMVPAGSGLKVNDFDDNLMLATITPQVAQATAMGGTVTVNADGSFEYTPPAGFTGNDSFTYTLEDGNAMPNAPAINDGTVTLTVSNMLWFIDNSSMATTSDGRVNTPFKSLADFNAGSAAAGEVVYIEYTGTDYTGGIVLANNERLFGEGHTGAANLAGVLPFTLAANSVALPNINGTRPVITNAGGDGISLAQNNTIRGLNVGNCADFAIDDNGNVGTLTISEVNINNSTGGGFRTDNGASLAVMLGSLTSGGGTNGVHLSGSGGSFTVSGATSVSNTTGIGLLIDGTSSGASTNFAAITIGGTGSHGIQLINNTGTVTASGTTTINSPVAGGNISLNVSGGGGAITFAGLAINGRRDKGIRIAGGNRNITTGTLSINNPNTSNAIGLEILSPTGGTISFGTTTINNNAAAGSAVEIQSSEAAITFASGSAISNSASNEFFVNGGNGNITYNGSITSTAGACLAVNSRTGGTTSFTGNISSTGAGIGIAVGSNTGGTVEFTGSSKSISSSTATAVNLTSNTGATINFTGGGLAITTTAGTGFTATGGGTVTVQGTGNTINSTSATALNVANTTIGGSGLTFQSISSGNNTAAADPTNGIVLNNTGLSGGITVTGTGTTQGSGGTIQFTAGDGISLNTSINLSLRNMIIQDIGNMAGVFDVNSGHDGIHAQSVSNIILDNMIIRRISDNAILGASGADPANNQATTITGLQILNSTIEHSNRFHIADVGDDNNEGMVRILGITGTVILSNSTFQHGAEFIDFFPISGTLNMTVTNCDFLHAYKEFTSGPLASKGNHGIDVTVQGNAVVNITIGDENNAALGNQFLNCSVGSVRLANDANATGDMTFIVSNNSFVSNDHSSGFGGDFDFPMGGLLLGSLGTNSPDVQAIVSNNYFDEITNASGGVGQFTLAMDGGQWEVLVENNTFDTPGNAPFFVRADNNMNDGIMNSTVLFQNNTYIRGGFCSPDPSAAGPGCGGCGSPVAGAGYCGPGLRGLVDVQNGANINITFFNEAFAKHDSGFDPGNTVEVRVLNTGGGGTACAHFMNNSSPEGYSVEQFAGTLNVYRTGSNTSCIGCTALQIQDVFGDKGNTGGGNNPLLAPPDVNVFGTVNTTDAICPVPAGGIFAMAPTNDDHMPVDNMVLLFGKQVELFDGPDSNETNSR